MMKVVDEADEKDKRDNNLEAMSSRKKNQGNHGNYNLNDHEFSVNNEESDPLYNNEKRDQDTIETKMNNSEPVLDNDDESSPLDTQNGNKNNNSNSINVVIENIGRKMLYKISDRPAIHSSIFFAFQNLLLALPWNLTVVILVAEVVCAEDDFELKAKLLSTTILLSGITTLIQVTFGIRLPVYQGPTASYVVPLLALKSLDEWKCTLPQEITGMTNVTYGNQSLALNTTKEELIREHLVLPRLQLMKGSLILAGSIHAVTGLTGMVGFLMRFIGPITVIPTILLIGLSLYEAVTGFCAIHWGIAGTTTTISLILSLYLSGWRMPIPIWTRQRGFHITRYPLQQVLSMLIAILMGWGIAGILTAAGVLTNDKNDIQYKARTDARSEVISNTPWFYIPYPGQFGGIDFEAGLFVAFLNATFVSIIDSIADYYACARISRVPPPPVHAVNRGIAVEGLMCIISGLFGTGHGTTTYGGHIGSIGITKVASVYVYQIFGVMLILCAIVGKFAAIFITIPYPVLGGVQIMGFGMFIGLVLSNLQYIDMQSTRNLAVIGISIMVGLMIPFWATNNPNALQTGYQQVDSFLKMVLTNPNLAGGFLACFLDNTVPGTKKERGLIGWDVGGATEDGEPPIGDYEETADVYEIPSLTRRLDRFKFLQHIPFSPTYKRSIVKK